MRLDLLAGAVGSAHRITERRYRHIDITFTVEAALEGGDPLQKQGVAVVRMVDRARQILHDVTHQAASSRLQVSKFAQRDATSYQRPPRVGVRRQRLVETCHEGSSQQIAKHDDRVRYPAVLADQRAEACRLAHQLGGGTHALRAGLSGDASRGVPEAIEAQARAGESDGIDCLTQTVFIPMDDRLRRLWKDFIQELSEGPQKVEVVAEKAPRFVT